MGAVYPVLQGHSAPLSHRYMFYAFMFYTALHRFSVTPVTSFLRLSGVLRPLLRMRCKDVIKHAVLFTHAVLLLFYVNQLDVPCIAAGLEINNIKLE